MSRQGDTMTGTFQLNGTAHTPQVATAGTIMHVSSQDVATRILFDNYNSGAGGANVTFRKARGTAAAPSALQSGDQVINIAAFGYGTTQYNAGPMKMGGQPAVDARAQADAWPKTMDFLRRTLGL